MVSLNEPIYCVEYENYRIALFLWGTDHLFHAQIYDPLGQPCGAAPKLYEMANDAIEGCKDLIDFLCDSPEFCRDPEETIPTVCFSEPTRRVIVPQPRMSA